jgi:hypothetical protein
MREDTRIGQTASVQICSPPVDRRAMRCCRFGLQQLKLIWHLSEFQQPNVRRGIRFKEDAP